MRPPASTPRHLAEILADSGAVPAEWADAIAVVPRELFLPDVVEAGDEVISRSGSPERWLAAVYDDVPLTTQINDGRALPDGAYRLPTSSSSMPSVMLEMLGLLDVAEGHRVLELGAGTGYNAGLLAHRLGSGNVTTVDIDPVLVERAAANLRAAGLRPRVVCGEGEEGWPGGAPYERVIATYTVPEIPYAWVEQAPAGRIVAPWGGSFFSHSFAVLDVADGEAHGRFSGYPAFMRTRTGRPPRGYLSDFLHHTDEDTPSRTALSPLAITGDADAQFFVGLGVPDAWHLLVDADDASGEATWWLLADDGKSWAAAEYVPGGDTEAGSDRTYTIGQYGPRRLWDEAERAYRSWESHDRPSRDRAGLSVARTGQHVWLDDPSNVVG
ncbi:methyltransferase domain-containing protein [Streptomyces sp. NPDC091212]|uniref:methyltransferase domain-containing protein n=1 Tax=Streptomyces sp. NPDC091212 TaxID=3155191 RepID=UPI003445ECC5